MDTRRILALGTKDCGVLDIIHDLTGGAPNVDASGSAAGLTHYWGIKTKYYSAHVPIWIDELDDPKAWKTEFIKPEAREVVQALGAWIYCFRSPLTSERLGIIEATLEAINDVIREHSCEDQDTTMLAVSLPSNQADRAGGPLDDAPTRERVEELCILNGFELVDAGATKMNEYGEKQGVDRIREALEANAWDITSGPQDDNFLDEESFLSPSVGDGRLDQEEAEMTHELFGLSSALRQDNEEGDELPSSITRETEEAAQIDDLDRMLQTLSVVREQSASLPEAERKRVAAQAVRKVMGLGL